MQLSVRDYILQVVRQHFASYFDPLDQLTLPFSHDEWYYMSETVAAVNNQTSLGIRVVTQIPANRNQKINNNEKMVIDNMRA